MRKRKRAAPLVGLRTMTRVRGFKTCIDVPKAGVATVC